MKLNVKELNTQEITSTAPSKKMRLSENAQNMVFQLFTKSVYSNPIGTVVREITSNCFDSHIEAKVNSPVIIRKTKDKENGNIFISFIDYGVGMSPDRIENIYMVYFESTKRIDNSQIGGFGIGGKTPLAYKRSTGQGEQEYDNSFHVITNFDGVKYIYLIYEGEDTPVVDLIHSEPTTEHNGTEVRIQVLEKDLRSFEKEMVRQLYYFENIIFEGFINEYNGEPTLANDYQIVRGKSFLFRGNEYSEYIHICLGRVAYPIDYGTLGLSGSDYRLPIALKLEVGDINVTVSRETVDYSESTIKMLKKKLEVAKDEIKELLAKQYENITTLEDYFMVKNDFGKLTFSNGRSINVGDLIRKSDCTFANFKYSSLIKMPNDKQLFSFFFEAKMYGKKPSSRRRNRYADVPTYFEGGYDTLMKNSPNILFVDGEFNRKIVKQAYLKESYGSFFIITKNELQYASKGDIADLFSHSFDKLTDDNGVLLPFVQTLQEMQEDYFELVTKHCTDYNEVEVPESFILTRKRESITKEMRNTTIPIRLVSEYGGSSSKRIKLNELFNFKEPIYYGTKEDEYTLQKASKIFALLFNRSAIVDEYDEYRNEFSHNNKEKIMFIQVAQNNLKYMEFCKNARPISTIYHTMFYRKADVVTSYFQTFDMIENYRQVPALYKMAGFYKVSPKWYNKAKEVKEFFDAMTYRDCGIGNMKFELNKYYNTDAVAKTPEQIRIGRLMKELADLQTKNEKIMEYINMPYRADTLSAELSDILKKIMVL